VFQEKRSIFWEVIVSVILSKKVYIYMCPIQNGFRDRAISLYTSKTVDKKEILRTVSNTGIYCSGDKVGTVYLV
jgi:predicted transport protein